MTTVVLALVALVIAILLGLGAWRFADKRSMRSTWANLVSHQPISPEVFHPDMIADLPVPAQRYFRFAIAAGAPLYTVAEISMHGELALGTRAEPNFMPMCAEQVLAAPYGFVWDVRAGAKVGFSGSDGAISDRSWSRFWLLSIVPVARAGNNDDHRRSAFGRYVAEAVFWTPAALLPGDHVRWEAVDNVTARVVVTYMGLQQAVDVTVGNNGQLSKVVFPRWSDANPAKTFQLQPFGGYLTEYRQFGAYRLPTRIEAGNFFETDDYFPFFKATVTSVRFPATNRKVGDDASD